MILSQVEAFSRYGGIVAVTIEWLALLTFYFVSPASFDGQHPLSYFATLPQTRVIFGVCYALAALSFWIFVKYHLNKHYQTPTQVFALSMLGFALVATVPFEFNDPATFLVHKFLALFFSITFIAGIFLMAKLNVQKQVRTVSLVTASTSTVLLVLFLLVQKDSQFILFLEVSSGLAAQFWMIWMSLHAYRK